MIDQDPAAVDAVGAQCDDSNRFGDDAMFLVQDAMRQCVEVVVVFNGHRRLQNDRAAVHRLRY